MNEMKTTPDNSGDDKKHLPILDLLINAKNDGKIDWNGLQEEFSTFMIAVCNCLRKNCLLEKQN